MPDEIKQFLMTKRIGVLMGGWSSEREVSLRSGRKVLESLRGQGFDAVGVDVDRALVEKIDREKIEVAFIILHGRPGEDGMVQGVLELRGIPYTGSGIEATAIGLDKITTKVLFEKAGIPTPDFIPIVRESDLTERIEEARIKLEPPLVLKPRFEGSSVGVEIIKDQTALFDACAKARAQFGDIFLEKFIKGMEATVGIVGRRALPILELVPVRREFYDYAAKYTDGETEFIIPARLDPATTETVQRLALRAHEAIGAEGFSRVDLMVDNDRRPMFLEINTQPGLTDLSDLPAEAAQIGMSYDELVFEILKSALRFFNKDFTATTKPGGGQ